MEFSSAQSWWMASLPILLVFLAFSAIFTVASGMAAVSEWVHRKWPQWFVCQDCAKGPDGDKQENKQD